jgi:hypothetical protein
MKHHIHGRHMRMNVSSRIASSSASRSDGKTSENAGVTTVSRFIRLLLCVPLMRWTKLLHN